MGDDWVGESMELLVGHGSEGGRGPRKDSEPCCFDCGGTWGRGQVGGGRDFSVGLRTRRAYGSTQVEMAVPKSHCLPGTLGLLQPARWFWESLDVNQNS